MAAMKRTLVLYSLSIVAAALLLEWLEYRFAVRSLSIQAYMTVIAMGFAALGIWVGRHLTTGQRATAFELNRRVVATLGISERELEVLEFVAAGHTNKEIAAKLHLSPHTIKTHVAHLYEKLDVSRRTQAVQKARQLQILP